MTYTLPDSAMILLPKPHYDELVKGLETTQADRDFFAEESLKQQQELERLRPQLADLNARIADLNAQAASAATQAKLRDDMILTLNAELTALKNPLPTAPLRITRQFLPRLYGLTIEKGKEAPSKTLYDTVRKAMLWARAMGFDTWRGYFNPQEVRDHLKAVPPLGNLVAYARAQGLTHFLADTVDTILNMPPATVDLAAYMTGLIALGCEGVYLNDADQYSFDVLKAMTKRLRAAAKEMPIFVSLRASANVDAYKNLVDENGQSLIDFVEIQTFGTAAELSKFLAIDDTRPYKLVMCLDARTPMTVQSYADRAAAILKNPPDQFFYYADLPGDYDAQPDAEDVVIRGLVSLLKLRP